MWLFKTIAPIKAGIAVSCLFVFMILSCTTGKKLPQHGIARKISDCIDTSAAIASGFTGLVVYDLQQEKYLFSENAEKYFIPASNAKIFTLYTCLHSLGDSIPALKYVETDSTFTFWGTGDPTLMHPFFQESNVISFLKSKAGTKKMILSDGHSTVSHYGSGWMWDDYNDYYQPELTAFPMYGNVLYVKKDSLGLTVSPEPLLRQSSKNDKIKKINRNPENNIFYIPALLDSVANFRQEVPYKDADEINIQLLERLLDNKIYKTSECIPDSAATLYSIPKDTVLRRMMEVSDNMLAEHLLLLSGFSAGDTISTTYSIGTAVSRYFDSIPQRPNWVDGSGLSRYNLCTPASLLYVLKKMYTEFAEERIFNLMAKGGGYGSLQRICVPEGATYLFAKSGSMSGVYTISGYLITRSGRRIAFSFMNNHFSGTISGVQKVAERLLLLLREL